MKNLIAKLVLAAALLASMIGLAAPAEAAPTLARTVVTWGGSYCIPVFGPGLFNPYTTGFHNQCTNGYAEWFHTGDEGMYVGVDPDMGSADWVRCSLYLNGVLDFVDFARAGDGHEASCLIRL